ncbi:MAG: hypothetical protein HYV60_05615 [Planctomycetia bacterium]|nr:hypothetical protein [Planctomycetia bacterium]
MRYLPAVLRKKRVLPDLPGDFREPPPSEPPTMPSIRLARAIARIETTERVVRDRAREQEISRLRELAKFD